MKSQDADTRRTTDLEPREGGAPINLEDGANSLIRLAETHKSLICLCIYRAAQGRFERTLSDNCVSVPQPHARRALLTEWSVISIKASKKGRPCFLLGRESFQASFICKSSLLFFTPSLLVLSDECYSSRETRRGTRRRSKGLTL